MPRICRVAVLWTLILLVVPFSDALAQQAAAPRQTAAPRTVAPAAQRQPAATAQRGPAANQNAAPGQRPAVRVQSPDQYPVRRTQATQPGPQGAAPQGTPQQQPAGAQLGAPQVGAPQPAQPGMVQPLVAPAPKEPFTLTAQQQALLDGILKNWELKNKDIGTFTCTFGRWETNVTFGPPAHDFVISIAFGDIKFRSPDQGIYEVNKQQDWDKAKNSYVPRTDTLDRWLCTGKAIYEYNTAKKELVERQLPPEMQGKAITDGPLPFVFGSEAEQLKRRYWMRDITQPADVSKQVVLEAWPKFQRDAANFQHAIIILNAKTFLPLGLRIVLPDGKNRQDYGFENQSVDNPLAVINFVGPKKPFGWTHVVIPAGGTEPAAAPAAPPSQARTPAPQQR